ncbi:hypothetical protein ACIBXA_30405 [Micromonospora echinaurantiaca]|uniref:hypothetical protein n=1 Tax=Micromonospora echinaurantiaca TaxID=47857 RepID=UPI0037943197
MVTIVTRSDECERRLPSKEPPFALWIGREKERTVVALRPMTLSGSKSEPDDADRVSRTVVPATTKVKSSGDAVRFLMVLVAAVGALGFCVAGAPWPVRIGLSILALILFIRFVNSSDELTVEQLQRFPDEHVIFEHSYDRSEFDKIARLAERIDRRTEAFQQLIPQAEAGETLARALWDTARLVSRQQDIRKVIEDLDQQDTSKLPADSAAVRDLAIQRERAAAALDDGKAELARRKAAFEALADSGDEFAREQEIREATRRAGDVLAGFGAAGAGGSQDESDRLAHHTLAVVEAYAALRSIFTEEAQ